MVPERFGDVSRAARRGSPGGSVRVIGCVAVFKEWAGKLHFSTYEYAKAPEVITREILKDSLGSPVQTKTGQVFRGYVLRTSDVQVGMKKITLLGPVRPPCTCDFEGVIKSLRGRIHIRCSSDTCSLATDREARTRGNEESHVNTERTPLCWCSVAPGSKLSGARHMHCRGCHRAFGRIERLFPH